MMQHKPLTIVTISLGNLKRRPFRTFGLAMMVAMFAFTLFGGSMLAQNLSNGIESLSKRLGADILVVPGGFTKNMEGALLRGEPSTFYLDGALTEKIRTLPGVQQASGQLFVASIDAECCVFPVQFIGYEQSTDFVIHSWLPKQINRPLEEDEVIVGSYILSKPGETLKFFGRPVKVVGVLDRTGMGFDTSIFMTQSTALHMMQAAHKIKPFPSEPSDSWISSVMVKVPKDQDVDAVAYSILKKYASEFDIRVVIAKNIMRDISTKLSRLTYLIYGLSVVFWIIAVGVLVIMFSISFNERKREFSLLRVMGATRRKLVALVLCESLMVSTLGTLIGIGMSGLVVFSFSTLIGSAIGLPYLHPPLSTILMIAGASSLLSLLVGPIASVYSAIRLGRSDIYMMIRENE